MTDITLCVTPKVRESMGQNQWKAFTGHLGTHFDVMDKVFPMEYAEREGIIFDVSRVGDGEVQISDIDLTRVCNFLWAARSRLIDVGGDSVTK